MAGAGVYPEIGATCRGEPRAVGQQLGEELRDRIIEARDSLATLDGFRCLQPWWLPYPAYLYWAEYQAWRLMEQPVREVFPAVAEQIEGMAEGAGLNLSSLYLFQAMESLMTALDLCCESPEGCGAATPGMAACTAVALRGGRSATGRPIIAHNFDNVDATQDFYVLRQRHGAGQYRTLEFTIAPLSGAVDGVNEKGLCITYNYGFTAGPGTPAPSVSMAISEALGKCATVREAISAISAAPRCGGALLMLADAEGDVAALEVASDRVQTRRPEGGDNFLFHSNAYQTPELKEVEAAPETRYSEHAPPPLRGRRVMESPERRDARLADLLAGPAVSNADDLVRVMSDHGAEGQADDGTICMHGDYWRTTASLQLFPADRTIRVAYGPACEAEYREFSL